MATIVAMRIVRESSAVLLANMTMIFFSVASDWASCASLTPLSYMRFWLRNLKISLFYIKNNQSQYLSRAMENVARWEGCLPSS